MATITVSAAGGNWNNTATWVGGVIPITTDDVRADATSGNLTVNVNVSVQFVNFTNWTGLLTINSTNTLTLNLAASTSTFSAAGTYSFLGAGATQGRIVKGNTAMSFNMLGTTPIPHFQSTGAATLTAASNLYFTNLFSTSTLNIAGNNTFISGDINMGFNTIYGTTIYNFVGTGSIQVLSSGLINQNFEFVIDCSGGTATISSQGFGIGNTTSNSNITFRHLSGTISNPTFRPNFNGGTSVHTFDLISGTTWDLYGLQNSITTNNITLTNSSFFDKFIIQSNSTSSTVQTTLSGNTFNINDLQIINVIFNSGGSYLLPSIDLIINTGTTVNVASSIDLNGGNNEPTTAQNPVIEVRSSSSGVQANLNVNTYNQYVSRTRFTDINCSGGNTLYGQTLTLSNTTNITQYTLPPSGGSGGTQTAYTFFS